MLTSGRRSSEKCPVTYMGVTIDRIQHSGMWRALVKGSYLKADTRAGLLELIREALK